MTIKQTQPPIDKPGEAQKPLLNITLPAPITGSPNEPLSVGRHNASAQKNFKQVANILLATISNQKLISLAITQQDKKINKLQKNMKTIGENIRKLLKEDKNERGNKKN